MSPFILNERLSVQQGVFLAGTDLTAEFMENLAALDKPSGVLRTHCIKITIAFDLDELQCALTELHVMNISRTALFPGIDGFAASLKNRLAMPHHFSELPKRGLWSSRGLAG